MYSNISWLRNYQNELSSSLCMLRLTNLYLHKEMIILLSDPKHVCHKALKTVLFKETSARGSLLEDKMN